MCKMRNYSNSLELIARRVERRSALKQYEQGRTPSFISASRKAYENEFADKNDIILLEIHLNDKVPFLELESVLGEEYRYSEEKEILLPPFVNVSVSKIGLSNDEIVHIRDMYNNPPSGKYQIYVKNLPDYVKSSLTSYSTEYVSEKILKDKEIAINAIEAMNRGDWERDFSSYIAWKGNLHIYLQHVLSEMWCRG